jgi:hypothetical protein
MPRAGLNFLAPELAAGSISRTMHDTGVAVRARCFGCNLGDGPGGSAPPDGTTPATWRGAGKAASWMALMLEADLAVGSMRSGGWNAVQISTWSSRTQLLRLLTKEPSV